jgi:hypothetical protein
MTFGLGCSFGRVLISILVIRYWTKTPLLMAGARASNTVLPWLWLKARRDSVLKVDEEDEGENLLGFRL